MITPPRCTKWHRLLLLVLIVAVSGLVIKEHRLENVKIDASTMVADNCKELIPTTIIYLDELETGNFTSTGFTYDSANQTFWIADHGTDSGDKLRLIELDSNLKKVLQEVQIENYTNDGKLNLQGIAYDTIDDAIWIAVGDSIQEISKRGKLTKVIDLGKYKKYQANGICMDNEDHTLWVLCYNKYMLHFDREGNLLKSYPVNMKDQDMIYMYDGLIYITVGADYKGEENYCVVFDTQTENIKIWYKLYQSYAVEGIYIDDDYIYVVNDGAFHNAMIPRTYISVYEY